MNTMRRRTTKYVMSSSALASLLAVLLSGMAEAAPPEELAFRGKAEVSDSVLGGMRGRYISADQILYFGVDMYTEWHTATDKTYGASLSIGIDRSASRVRPQVSVSSSVRASGSGNGSAPATSTRQIDSGGLSDVRGVSQVVQTTGSGNGIANNIGIDVGTQRPATATSANSLQTGGNQKFVDKQSGATILTYVNQTGAGVVVSIPQQGVVSQSIASAIGMQQQAQVTGDANNVHNQLNMVIQLQANSAVTANINNLSQTVRGLGQLGIN